MSADVYGGGVVILYAVEVGLVLLFLLYTMLWRLWLWTGDEAPRETPLTTWVRGEDENPYSPIGPWEKHMEVFFFPVFFGPLLWPLIPPLLLLASLAFTVRFLRRTKRAVAALSDSAHTHETTEHTAAGIPTVRARGGRYE